jgi:2'-5' RNA ligase
VSAAPPRLRLFFALWPDDATRAGLAERARALHHAAGGRATRPRSIHLTLAFLGNCDPARLDEVQRAASRVRVRSFELVLDAAGLWHQNRIAWVGARVVPPELAVLVADLRDALEHARVVFDPKPFVPHVTLVRKARPNARLPAIEPIGWPVSEFVLVRSVPRSQETEPQGSDYLIAARWG